MICTESPGLPSPPIEKRGWPWIIEQVQVASTMPDGSPWPRISIVTPSYNQGQFIEKTIRSVLLQHYPNLEYIIVDAGSKDGSLDIIKKYEPWLAYWVSEKDRGQSHAINKGFSKATGEIYGWVNSDDGYLPGTFALVAQSMHGKKRNIVVGASKIVTEHEGYPEKVDCRHPTYDEMLYEGRSFPQPSVFWTKDLWDAVNCMREELFYAMDYDTWLRMLPIAESVTFTDQILSYQHSHPEQKMMFKNKIEEKIYLSQKAYVVLHAAKLIGIQPLNWLVKSYLRRTPNALRKRTYASLGGSKLQKAVFRALFYKNYISWMPLI